MSGGVNRSDLLAALAAKRSAWQEAISSARNKIDAIDRITKRVTGSKEAAMLQELSDEQRAWLLVKMVCVEDLHVSLLSEALWL